MHKKLRSYQDWLGAKLADPKRAARYLNAAAADSEAMFLKSLRKVALSQDRSMTDIAEACGVSRESLYRMLSETGNPTSDNRRAILTALGLKSIIVPMEETIPIRGSASGLQDKLLGTRPPLHGNALSGGSRSEFVVQSGTISFMAQALKAPGQALDNFASVGHSAIAEQTGGLVGRQ
jgi:probable addiction module antidote protein